MTQFCGIPIMHSYIVDMRDSFYCEVDTGIAIVLRCISSLFMVTEQPQNYFG